MRGSPEDGETMKDLTWAELQVEAAGNMKDEDIAKLRDAGLYTFSAPPGSLVYIPPHYVVWERSSVKSYGFRYSFVYEMPKDVLNSIGHVKKYCADAYPEVAEVADALMAMHT